MRHRGVKEALGVQKEVVMEVLWRREESAKTPTYLTTPCFTGVWGALRRLRRSFRKYGLSTGVKMCQVASMGMHNPNLLSHNTGIGVISFQAKETENCMGAQSDLGPQHDPALALDTLLQNGWDRQKCGGSGGVNHLGRRGVIPKRCTNAFFSPTGILLKKPLKSLCSPFF